MRGEGGREAMVAGRDKGGGGGERGNEASSSSSSF